jgi:hypothetical protein
MRFRRESLLLLGLFTSLCALVSVLAGIATGILVASPPEAPPTEALAVARPAASPTAPPAVVTPSEPGRQRSLLIIGVNDLEAEQPRFEGCWVITYRTGDSNYYGVSFPPGAAYTVEGLAGTYTLTQVFEQDRSQGRGYAFLRDAIQTRFPGSVVEADLVLDRGDLAALVGEAGGVALDGQRLAGSDLLAAYDLIPPPAEGDRLAFQQRLFQALFAALGQDGWTLAALAEFLRDSGSLAAEGPRASALDAFAAEAPPLHDATLVWLAPPTGSLGQ